MVTLKVLSIITLAGAVRMILIRAYGLSGLGDYQGTTRKKIVFHFLFNKLERG